MSTYSNNSLGFVLSTVHYHHCVQLVYISLFASGFKSSSVDINLNDNTNERCLWSFYRMSSKSYYENKTHQFSFSHRRFILQHSNVGGNMENKMQISCWRQIHSPKEGVKVRRCLLGIKFPFSRPKSQIWIFLFGARDCGTPSTIRGVKMNFKLFSVIYRIDQN